MYWKGRIKVKKMLSAGLLVFFTVSSMTLSLAAGETITQDSQGKNSDITVNYNAGVSYTVTIPASVTFSETEKEVERSLLVSDVVLNEGSSVNINLTSLNNFKMVYGKGYIEYYLKVNHNDVLTESQDTILTVAAGENSGWVVLSFITDLQKDHVLYAGNYTDTLTFTVEVD